MKVKCEFDKRTGKIIRPMRRPPRNATPQPAQVPARTVLNDTSSDCQTGRVVAVVVVMVVVVG